MVFLETHCDCGREGDIIFFGDGDIDNGHRILHYVTMTHDLLHLTMFDGVVVVVIVF